MCATDTIRITMPAGHEILRSYRLKQGISPEDFAKQLGVAEPTLRSLENGTRAITPERAVEIEEKTDGALTRHDLREDIFGPAPKPERKKAAA